MEQIKPIEVFISYAHDDEVWLDKLGTHLSNMEKQGVISAWYDGKIGPGINWEEEIKKHLEEARLILLLISHNFLQSEYCIKTEMRKALVRQSSGSAHVIPIILSPCDWKQADFAKGDYKLQALPKKGFAICNWKNEDEAFADIIGNLRNTILDMKPSIKTSGTRSTQSMKKYIELENDCYRSIGIDVGATKIACGLVTIKKDVMPKYTKKNVFRIKHNSKSASGMLKEITCVIDEVIRKEGISKDKIDSIGLGLPGMVRREDGFLYFAPGLQISNFNICPLLKKTYNVPVHADNDVNCSTLAELVAGYGDSFEDFVCVFVGTGIGAGVVVDNRIVRGHNFSAGEIGHMKIDFLPDARECTCGQKGCYEEYAGARAIIRLARVKIFDLIERKNDKGLAKKNPREVTPQDIVALMKKGDEGAEDLAKEIAGYLSIGLANIANILNPQAIILGGGVIEGFFDFPYFEQTMITKFNEYAPPACAKTSLIKSSFESTTSVSPAPIIGAALLPFERDFV